MWYNVASGFILNPYYLGGIAMDSHLDEEYVDYRKMYYHLAGAVESAIRILIAAQQKCENILLDEENGHSE